MKQQPQDDRLIYMHAEVDARNNKTGLWVDESLCRRGSGVGGKAIV